MFLKRISHFKKLLFLFFLFKCSASYAFDPKTLLIPNESWQFEIDDKGGPFKVLVSYFGSKFYADDLKNKRLENIKDDDGMLLTVTSHVTDSSRSQYPDSTKLFIPHINQ